jgi:hypothetical protein
VSAFASVFNIPTNAGLFTVTGGNNLLTKGTINNTGTIVLSSNGNCIGLTASTTLAGSGQVTMNPNTCFLAFATGLKLTNKSTIQGSGSIGDSNPMGITNTGTIIANQSTPMLVVPDGSGFINTGTLIVSSGIPECKHSYQLCEDYPNRCCGKYPLIAPLQLVLLPISPRIPQRVCFLFGVDKCSPQAGALSIMEK